MAKFTARQKADCAKHELGQRRYVYGRRVADGKMKQDKADLEIALMQEIHDEYNAAAEKEEAAGRLL